VTCPHLLHQPDVRLRRSLHAGTQEESGVGRLVVGYILPGNRLTILRVVHERVDAMLRRDDGRVDAQFLVVGCSLDQLFTPVAKEIGAKCRCGLAAVVGLAPFGCENPAHLACFPIPLTDCISVQYFTQQVTVPPDGEVVAASHLDGFAFDVTGTARSAKAFGSGIPGVHVHSETSTAVGIGGFLNDLTRACIEQCCARGSATFVNAENFKPRAVNRTLKKAVLGAAISAINQKDNVFRDYYERMVQDGIITSNARHAVARKLLTVMWGMWKTNSPFNENLLCVELNRTTASIVSR